MTLRLLTDHHFEFLSLKGGRTGSSESTFVKMPHCWNHMSRLIIQTVLPVYNNGLQCVSRKVESSTISNVDFTSQNKSIVYTFVIIMIYERKPCFVTCFAQLT